MADTWGWFSIIKSNIIPMSMAMLGSPFQETSKKTPVVFNVILVFLPYNMDQYVSNDLNIYPYYLPIYHTMYQTRINYIYIHIHNIYIYHIYVYTIYIYIYNHIYIPLYTILYCTIPIYPRTHKKKNMGTAPPLLAPWRSRPLPWLGSDPAMLWSLWSLCSRGKRRRNHGFNHDITRIICLKYV